MLSESRELVRRASKGDRPAIDDLLAMHLPGLRAFLRLRAGPVIRRRESVSDLAQSVCREVLEQVDRVQYGDEPGFKRWLYTTALRKVLHRYEYYAAEKRNFLREQPQAPGSTASSAAASTAIADLYRTFSTPSQHATRKEDLERVEQAFDALTEEQREVVTLAHVVGLPRGEIAQQLGKSEGAVRTMLSRAPAQLADLLEDERRPA